MPTTHGQRSRASHIISGLSPSLTIISMRSSRQASTSLQQICTHTDIKTPVQCHRCLYLKQPGKSLTKVLESMRYLVLVLQEIVVQPLHTALPLSSPRAADLHEGGAEVAGDLVTRPRDVPGLHPARHRSHRGGGLGARQGGRSHDQHQQQHGFKCYESRE